MHAAAFRHCLETLDVEGVRRLWAHASPHLTQPKDDAEALASLHMARTQCDALPLKARAYSHRWLTEQGLPSQLPDTLKQSAERLYPRVVTAVGLAISLGNDALKPAADMIRAAMNAEIEDCYASKREAPDYVKPRMNAVGEKERRKLFGHLTKLYSLGSAR